MLLPSLHWLYESSRSPQRLPGILVDGGANVGRATARHGAKCSKNPLNFFFVGLVETHFFHRRCLWISLFFLVKFRNPDPPKISGTFFFFFLRWTICWVWGYLQGLRLEFELPTTIFRFRNWKYSFCPRWRCFQDFWGLEHVVEPLNRCEDFFLAPGGLRVLGIVSWTQSWILGDGWLDTW